MATLRSILSAACLCAVTSFGAAGAHAVVVDDFESYNLGDDASTANPARFTDVGGNPVGNIATGIATANVASSQVLEHDSDGSAQHTRVNSAAPLTGDVTLSFDFLVTSAVASHNIYVRDAAGGLEGVLIRFLAGDATRYFVQVRGTSGYAVVYEAFANYGDWIRGTVNLHLDAGTPSNSSFDISFHDLTTGSALAPHVNTGSSLTLSSLGQIDQMQLETPGEGRVQYDNFTAPLVPEPASMALLTLGAVAMVARRR